MREVCVNPACYRWGTSLADFVTASATAGFTAIEVSIQQAAALGTELGGLGALTRWRRNAGVAVTQFSGLIPAGPVLPSPLLTSEDHFTASLRTLDHRLAVAEALECRRAAIVVNPRTELNRAAATDLALTRLDLLSARAAEHGVRLAAEFIGVRRDLDASLDGAEPFIGNVGDLVGLLDQTTGNVGVLIDLCHLFASSSSLDEVAALRGRLEFVQVCDIPPDVAPNEMTDSARCLPGNGTLDFGHVAAVLDTAGYSGPLSIELFSPDLWQYDPPAAASKLYASANALFPTSASEVIR